MALQTYQLSDIELAIDAQKELYRRDFELFAREQLWITTIEPGKFQHFYPFTTPQSFLEKTWKEQQKEDGWVRIVAIKGRQFGFSTDSIAHAFHLAALNAGVETLHIAQDDDTASAIFSKAKMFYDRMDDRFRPLSRFDNKKVLRFENPDAKTRHKFPGLSSQMRISHAKNVMAGTGTTQHFLHLSESAKYPSDMCALLESSFMPALHLKPGTVCINESTAYLNGEYFRSCCERAMSGKSEWRFVFVPWFADQRYFLPLKKGEKIKLDDTEKWIQRTAKKGQIYGNYEFPPMDIRPEQFKWRRFIISGREDGENIFKQEYPTTFEEAWITLDVNVFRRDKMYEMRKDLKNPLRFAQILPSGRVIDDPNGQLGAENEYFAIWEEPQRNEKYDIGLDTSAGLEDGDFCVAEVKNRRTNEQVAEYRVRKDAMELGEQIYWLGRFYNTAQIALEMANTGFACNAQLQRLGYPYLYIWRHRERSFPTLSSYTGWKTSRESKSYLISLYTSLVNKLELKIHSHVLWNEMYNYIRMPGMSDMYDSYRAERGYDDTVMAMGICIVASDDETFGRHSPEQHEELDRQAAIAAELAKGGLAFRDSDERFEKANFMKTQKLFTKGWD